VEATLEEPRSKLRSPVFLGMVMFLVSEAFLFGSLFWTYYYLRVKTAVWLPEGVQIESTLATWNTLVLLSSSATAWFGVRSIRKGNEKGLAFGLAATAFLGVGFLGITFWEWANETFRPWTHAYGSIFYTLTGFHALHVLGGALLMLVLLRRTLRGRFSSGNCMAVEAGSLYWHFVDFIWLLVFGTLFIVR